MEFYKSINKYYEKVFPLNLKQVEYIKKYIPLNTKLLEVGSAKGSLTNELSKYYNIEGIDLDESFVRSSKELYPNISFYALNMLDIPKQYKKASLDGIICFGNTLVHLDNKEMIDRFLKNCYTVLKVNGILSIQIINYNRILDNNISNLPTIKNDYVEFIRNYQIVDKHIMFNTTLKILKENIELSNSIRLYPIKKEELGKLLIKNGFEDIHFQSSFDNDDYDSSKIPLILRCKKSM